jgi:hypothetical protein
MRALPTALSSAAKQSGSRRADTGMEITDFTSCSFGLTVKGELTIPTVPYTPKDDEEREVCSFLVSESYHCVCKFAGVR